MWSPWPVCLVWIHRRGCSLDVGWCGRLGDVAAGWSVWFVVMWSPWPGALSDVRRWCVAGLSMWPGVDFTGAAAPSMWVGVVALVMWPPVGRCGSWCGLVVDVAGCGFHRRGCSVSLGGRRVPGMDWPLWVRCQMCAAGSWPLGCRLGDVVAVGVAGLSMWDCGRWLVGDKPARL